MGNMLEASPDEGAWGVRFEPEYFVLIKQRGFDFVRLPVGWQNHLMIKGDTTTISKTFLARVKYIVDEAIKNDLGIIINIHHFDDMGKDPEKYESRLYEFWRVISEHFQNYPPNVVFEVFNEPHDKLNTKTWNKYQNECIKIIRETNPTRKIVVSAGDWGGTGGIMDLIIPEDENLILSVHYYDPFNFTHQGADWTGGDMDKYLGTKWTGTDFEKKNIENMFKTVKAWSEAAKIPVLLGEFGAYSKADMESREKWTAYMRETAEYYGFAWSYWEFCAGFGIYDPNKKVFFDGLANALTGTPMNEKTYATKNGTVKVTAPREGGFFGPFKIDRNMNIVCDSWTGMSIFDTEQGTQIIELNSGVVDWAQAFILIDDLKDTGEKFSHDTAELTIRNIDGSITDFCINLDNRDIEGTLLWMTEKQLKGNSKDVVQNADGTTTIILNLNKLYKQFKGKCENGMRIKMFIESVPDRNKTYDREGAVEFIKIELK
jgi:endoglucanase